MNEVFFIFEVLENEEQQTSHNNHKKTAHFNPLKIASALWSTQKLHCTFLLTTTFLSLKFIQIENPLKQNQFSFISFQGQL